MTCETRGCIAPTRPVIVSGRRTDMCDECIDFWREARTVTIRVVA